MRIRHVNKRFFTSKLKLYATGWVLEVWDEENSRWLPVPSVTIDYIDPPKEKSHYWDKLKFWKHFD